MPWLLLLHHMIVLLLVHGDEDPLQVLSSLEHALGAKKVIPSYQGLSRAAWPLVGLILPYFVP